MAVGKTVNSNKLPFGKKKKSMFACSCKQWQQWRGSRRGKGGAVDASQVAGDAVC